jgi:threonine aldolase
MIDLRSDTVTQPSPEMRAAMAAAPVGDDVIDVDPTVEELQQATAEILGMEAAMFMPSGTMTNQVAVRLHCRPGDEFICDEGCHIFNYEQGAFAQLSQAIARTVPGRYGIMSLDQVAGLIRPDNEHATRTRLLTLENTHNRGGGTIWPLEQVQQLCGWARQHGLRTHLDGARLFNAVVGSGIAARTWAESFDTVSVCFSKGLGAPVGSALAGRREFINDMRRHRKLFGGGMRQSGIIAAGALFALRNNIDRLADDHASAQRLASRIAQSSHLRLDPPQVESNIVLFRMAAGVGTAERLCALAKSQGVWVFPFGPQQVRAVTHLHISSTDADRAGTILCEMAEKMSLDRSLASKS